MEPYYKLVPYAIKERTRQKLLDLAYAPDAFVDISYKISFFKLPNKFFGEETVNTKSTSKNCFEVLQKLSDRLNFLHKKIKIIFPNTQMP